MIAGEVLKQRKGFGAPTARGCDPVDTGSSAFPLTAPTGGLKDRIRTFPSEQADEALPSTTTTRSDLEHAGRPKGTLVLAGGILNLIAMDRPDVFGLSDDEIIANVRDRRGPREWMTFAQPGWVKSVGMEAETMKRDQEKWRADRKAALVAEDGWLNLVARIALPFGTHRVGSAPDCDIRLPSGPAVLGDISHTEEGAVFSPIGGAPEPFVMASGGFPQLRVPPLLLELHDPGGQPALRVRDLTLPRTISLEYFPTDPDWVVTAQWIALEVPERTSIGQKGASNTDVTVTHQARFRHGSETHTIVPTHWKGGKPMFVFRDGTSGTETYAASRFLFGEDAFDGQIILDFNRAHNPPCAFTEFAICPLPPPGNVLPFPVRAGELAP